MKEKQKTRVTSTLISEVTGIPDSSVRAANNGRLKDPEQIKRIGQAEAFLEEGMNKLVERAKTKFSPTKV